MDIVQLLLIQNQWRSWLLAGGAAVLLWVVMQGAKRLLVSRLEDVAERTERPAVPLIAGLLQRTLGVVLAVVSLYAGSQLLALPDIVGLWSRTILMLFVLLQLGVWGSRLIGYGVARYAESRAESSDEVTTLQGLSFVARVGLYAVLIVLALDNIPGVKVDTLLASLGIGGIAVALAVQNILGDLFASLSIALDKPFTVGDFINVDGMTGSVEHIGLKTTRVRSLSGEELVFSNSDLLSSRIRNYKSMQERRVAFTLGVSCETRPELLREIPGIIEEIIAAQPEVRFERAHFSGFGDFTFDFDIVYHMLDADFGLYMDTRQAINLSILERFAERGIEMPYPTQAIRLEQAPRRLLDEREVTEGL